MNKFLEKIAESKEEKRSNPKRAIGAYAIGSLAATPLQAGVLASGLKMKELSFSNDSIADLGTVKRFMKGNNLHKKVTFNTRPHSVQREKAGPLARKTVSTIDLSESPAYVHNRKGRGFIGGVKTFSFFGPKRSVNKDVIMHELGHAKDFSRHGTLKQVGTFLARHPVSKLGFGAATIGALSSKDEKKRNLAPAIAAVPGALMMREEGAANYHAYKGIKADKGAKAANKFLKRLVAKNMTNYGLAAAVPVASTYVAKKIMDKSFTRKTEQS